MSASTASNHGTRGRPMLAEQGRKSPARAMRDARPRARREAVLPPVLGPVMATTLQKTSRGWGVV